MQLAWHILVREMKGGLLLERDEVNDSWAFQFRLRSLYIAFLRMSLNEQPCHVLLISEFFFMYKRKLLLHFIYQKQRLYITNEPWQQFPFAPFSPNP